jgi:glycerol-1-phosphate dehydrogenase [NAD(P)+]
MTAPITFAERIIATGALGQLPQACMRHGLGAEILTVGDTATLQAAGEAVAGDVHMLGAQPKALLSHAEALVERAASATGLIAIGSGTVNDITKLAAHRLGIPYLCVATAASMNGYSSGTASLIAHGHKQSFAASPARAVIADLELLAKSPRRMTRAGLGDTLCRSTVLADAYLGHLVTGSDFPREWFERLRTHEAWLMQHAALVREGAVDFLEKLMHALLDAGDAMLATGSSAIASQGEHMIAHTLELMYGDAIYDVLHGELIAVTTSTVALLQHKMMLSQPELRITARDDKPFLRHFGQENGARLYALYQEKMALAAQVNDFPERWATLCAALPELIAPFQAIERAFTEAGLATRPAGIGLLEDRYNAALTYAHLTRERFTFLDLAAMNARRA